jgi:hypothetical protein
MAVALQFAGALGILVPFALFQLGLLSQHAAGYLLLNLAGAGLLTALALVERQWGFVVLQGVWALAALAGLLRRRAREG